jgi:guanylate kinase
MIYVVVGKSGSGKSHIVGSVLLVDKKIKYVKSHTTRNKRPSDNDWEYKFVSVGEFKLNSNNGVYVESAMVYGNYYGLLKSDLVDYIDTNHLITILDINGARSIKKLFLAKTKLVNIVSKSDYLDIRGDSFERRELEIEHNKEEFDIVINNGLTEEPIRQLLGFISKEVI